MKTNPPVYMWEFLYYDDKTGEYEEVCYYTYSDNSEMALRQFELDDPGVDYTLISAGPIQESTLIEWYGNADLVLENLPDD